MINFKVKLILLVRLAIKSKLDIDLINSATDVIKVPTTFNTTGGYSNIYGAGTYDIIGSENGSSFVLRLYCRYGDDTRLSDITIDSARNGVADRIYSLNLTLVEEDFFYHGKDNGFPKVDGQVITRDAFCDDELSFNLKDVYGNNLCAGVGHIPEITLTDGDVTIFKNSVWIDPGYIAMDVEYGDISANVITVGAIDTSIVGDQVLTYAVTDSDGGTFTIPRTVTVRLPNVLPLLTLLPVPSGSVTPITLVENDSYTDPGATAIDSEDGDLTPQIVVTGDTVDTSVPGTYNVIYSVTDLDGATSVLTREVVVQANNLPVITLNPIPSGDITPIDILFGGDWIDPGATAVDTEQGDISARIVIGGDTVDISTAGTYNVTYTVTDDNLGSVTVTRVVTILQNQIPVVTLNQFNGETTPIILPYHGTYTEAGAISLDVEDGNITAGIVIAGGVDTNVPGIHTVTYTSTDSAGESGIATRIVTVSANIAPTITLNNYGDTGVSTPVTLDADTLWNDPGYSAADAEDGDISADVVVSGDTVDMSTPGTYNIDYSVTDSGGLVGTAARVVNVVAVNVAPTVTILPDGVGDTTSVRFNIVSGNPWIDPGASAIDGEDGDLTADIVTTSTLAGYTGTVPASNALLGTHTITYTVSDSEGLTDSKTRTLEIYQDLAPTINLENLPSGAVDGSIARGSVWVEPGYTASDVEDGNLTGDVVIGGDVVNTTANGTYIITYTVSDADGKSTTTSRTIEVTNTIPTVTIIGANPLIIASGATWVDPGASANDAQDGDISGDVVVSGDVIDTSVSGNYNVIYTVTDIDGASISATRVVTVATNLIPSITLNGINGDTTPININQNDVWADPGATATDPEDGDISGDIVITGDVVDTSAVGSYIVVYTATDSQGASINVSRVINVSGTNPVLTLTPASDGAIENVYRKIDVDANYVEPGATAMDAEDGNISASVTMYNATTQSAWAVGDVIPANVGSEGTWAINYTVTDNDGLSDTKIRHISIGYQASEIVLEEDDYGNSDTTFVVQNAAWSDPGAFVDTWESPIPNQVVVSGDVVDTTAPLNTSFVILYNYTDSLGNNATQVVRTVTIVSAETSINLIEINGVATPVDVDQNSVWGDPGASAWDIADGDVTGGVVVSGDTVDTAVLGTYNVVYTIIDTATATVTRVVNVVAVNTLPTITLLGDNPSNIYNGSAWVDPGYSAADAEDGNISGDVVVGGDAVDTATDGTYNVTYTVTDSAGGETVETRSVVVTTNIAPTVTLVGDNPLNLAHGETYTDPGATATDTDDGDISGDIVVSGDVVDTSTTGTYNVVYTVTDSGGLDGTATRAVVVAVNNAPVITLLGDSPMTIENGTVWTEPGYSAADNEDGDISADVVVGGDVVDTATDGTYSVTYTVTDSAGLDGNATRTVTVTTNMAPVITLTGDNPIDVIQNTVWAEPGYDAVDNEDGNITGDVVVSGDVVDTTTIGTYNVVYTVTDSGGLDGTVTRVVNVVVNTLPTITLLGDNPIDVNVDTVWTDPGYSAADAEDGDISADVVVSGDVVDTTTTDAYTVTYTVNDANGGSATIDRIVNVVDACTTTNVDTDYTMVDTAAADYTVVDVSSTVNPVACPNPVAVPVDYTMVDTAAADYTITDV